MRVQRWERYSVQLNAKAPGNPFIDARLSCRFSCAGKEAVVDGFYDGEGRYEIRFMPDIVGEWTWITQSNLPELDQISGAFTCTQAKEGVHGPVYANGTSFCYADGGRFIPVGTTCYAWTHQEKRLEEQTLETLGKSPFNKVRMCLFPKHYRFNNNNPPFYPFMQEQSGGFDFTRFNPAYYRHLETRLDQLAELGIQADLILFHPYDCWGFSKMDRETNMRYLTYTVARLASFRNIWWSMANEYDLIANRQTSEWDEAFQLLAQKDAYHHLRSIHNARVFYDYTKPWITHLSIQSSNVQNVPDWVAQYHKPVILDECCYEGDIDRFWGSLTAQEMVRRMWEAFTLCGYASHGETYMAADDVLWWAKGGVLRGDSVARIAFLKEILEQLPEGYGLYCDCFGVKQGVRKGDECFLIYLLDRQMRQYILSLPEGRQYAVEIIDTWNCSVTSLDGTWGNGDTLSLPGKPYQALRLTEVKQ